MGRRKSGKKGRSAWWKLGGAECISGRMSRPVEKGRIGTCSGPRESCNQTKKKHRISKEHRGVVWAEHMKDAWRRRGKISDKSRDGVYICGTPYARGGPVGGAKNDQEVQACTQIYVCMACVCKHPSANDRRWPNGNRDKEELRKHARENEETGK
ncbi:hypothetical protein K438DRAFT_1766369 [Mycena galopus ATCC 62051]|nr:hypothetical protein K438DRAFT_1766369 [Mycena galopus ATCC 62051]